MGAGRKRQVLLCTMSESPVAYRHLFEPIVVRG